jgi:hypothetical protein
MIPLLYLLFLFIVSGVVFHLWKTGNISGLPKTRREKISAAVAILAAINFVAFVIHILNDGACALFGVGRLVDGHYLVVNHGRNVVFSAAGYAFNYWHTLFFIIMQVACMMALWRSRGNGEFAGDSWFR